MTPAAPHDVATTEPGPTEPPTAQTRRHSATRVLLGTALILMTLFLIWFVYVQISAQFTDAVGGCGGG